jgi:hypothetical protein
VEGLRGRGGYERHKLRNAVKTMKEPISEDDVVRETISDLQELIEKLDEEREVLSWRIAEKQERVRWYQAKLGQTGSDPAIERKRSPRGANLKVVMGVLQDPSSPRQGLTASEVVAKAGLSFSSVQAALKQGKDASVIEQVENFWRPKLESKPAEPKAPEVAVPARNGNMS